MKVLFTSLCLSRLAEDVACRTARDHKPKER
jgi:hypothetical protein